MFQLTPAGALTTLYTFTGGNDGSQPYAGLIQGNDGSLYGETSAGGASGNGTVFKLTTAGALTTLYSFSESDGAQPQSGLVQAGDGSFYGTTSAGGTNGAGTVFKLSVTAASSTFFAGEVPVGGGVYFLDLPTGNPFGYYSYLSDPRYLYHFDFGWEYVFDANDGKSGVYLYDFASDDFFYTSPDVPLPVPVRLRSELDGVLLSRHRPTPGITRRTRVTSTISPAARSSRSSRGFGKLGKGRNERRC